MRILGKDCEVGPRVPEPLPFRKFMVYIGPAMMTIALGLGTNEQILSPRLTAEFGTGWIGMMVLSLVFQTVWAQQMARWTVLWDIPDKMNWWILGSTLSWVGGGPTLLWYTYWMKDAGRGMACNFDAICSARPAPPRASGRASPACSGAGHQRPGIVLSRGRDTSVRARRPAP